MPLLERFAATFRRLEPEDGSQESREALVDLLVWTMFVDHHLALREHEALDALTRDLPWRSVTTLGDFFSQSVARAREALDDPAASERYLRDIGQRLGDEEVRRKAVAACEQMMTSDGKMTREEVAHFRAVSKAFGLR